MAAAGSRGAARSAQRARVSEAGGAGGARGLGPAPEAHEGVRAELRFADRGYSGFFDDVKLDGDAALDAVYAQDERIVLQVEEIAAQVAEPEFSPAKLRGSVKRLGLALADRRNAILGLGSR